MEKEFVPYEFAVKLKELGFEESCLAGFDDDGDLHILRVDFQSDIEGFCLAPTFSQAFRWFREKYNLHANKSGNENYTLFNLTEPEIVVLAYCDYHKTKNHYEEAELASLDKLIEIVETKTK